MTQAEPGAPLLERLAGYFSRRPLLLGALLLLSTLLLYSRVAHFEFLDYDDSQYVTRNVHVSTGLNPGNVAWAFTSFYAGNWHPLTWLSHMLDCQLFGLNSGAHHLVNAVLHAVNVLLLFWLLQKGTRAVWRSFLVAALFALHPLNVETVAWVAERKSLLSMLFSLLTIAAYGWYVRRPSWKKYLATMAAFSLALMSKPMAVTLPLVLLLFDYWPLKRFGDLDFRSKWSQLTREKLPLLLMSAGNSAVTVAAQRSAIVDTSSLPPSLRGGNAILSYLAYIGKTLWPARLAVFYPHPQHGLLWSDVIAATVIIAAITAAVAYLHRARYLTVGWLLFVVTLIPVIGIVQVGRQAMADHYMYVPCIGLFIMLSWGIGDFAAATALHRTVPAAAALLVVVAFAASASHYLSYWQNGVKLFTQAGSVARQPDPVIEAALGDSMVVDRRYDEAYPHYAEACLLRPGDDVCRYNMAEILFHRHQLQDALEQYQIAQSLTHSQDMLLACLVNSGEILEDLGEYPAAQIKLAAALQIDPRNAAALRLQQRAFGREGSQGH